MAMCSSLSGDNSAYSPNLNYESGGAGPTAAARVRPTADHGVCSGGKGSNQRQRGLDQQQLRGVQPAAATACFGGGGSDVGQGGGDGLPRRRIWPCARQ
ncbi:hypothetical protein Syun_025438 [Stephania yunnanensis]|uniref:Uncharacterized protein n=1 Tax=Stephania yunnanensis TaxID=152371 RepID=A0AAP0EYU1_9MAGN